MSKAETISLAKDNLPSGDAIAREIWGLRAGESDNALLLLTGEGHVHWQNAAARGLFGLDPDAQAWSILPTASTFDRPRADNFGFEGLHMTTRGEGAARIWLLQDVARLLISGQQMISVATQNITRPIEATFTRNDIHAGQTQSLDHAAFHDELTGLANRRYLKRFVDRPEFREAMSRRAVGVLLLDLDKFKEINDTLGHAAGDALLVHTARALKKATGSKDIACRTGGDEFVIFCIGPVDRDGLMARAEIVLRHLTEEMRWGDQTIRIGTSIGASLSSETEETGEDLLHHADQALYAAKSLGRGRVVFFTPQIGQVQRAQNQMAREIRIAVAKDQFEVLLQPQIDLAQDRVTGCEALLRWNHPRLGQLAPGEFFDTARRASVLSEIDHHAMHLSLNALETLDRAGFSDLTLAINVSAEILSDANYPGLLDWALQSRGLNPSRICVEVNEMTIYGKGADAMQSAIERLKDFGTRIALDDFGTGYSGLSHMSDSGVDMIKLDPSIVTRLDSEHRSRAIMKSIVDLCGKLGTEVIAEGVETPAQRDILRQAGCVHVQGFELAHPMSVADTIAWLRRFRAKSP